MLELCIVLAIVAIGLLLWAIIEHKKYKNLQQDWDNYFNTKDENELIIESLVNDEIETKRIEALQRLEYLNADISFQNNRLNDIKKEIQAKLSINENQRRLMVDNANELDRYLQSIEEKKKELKNLVFDIDAKQTEFKVASGSYEILELQISQLKDELEIVCQQHKEATKRLGEENVGRVMDFTVVDIELTELLEKLKIQYPQLSEVFSTAEWTKIWQPKFQAMTADINPKVDRCGIYRIFTIDENGFCRNYVGQAKKIRERWSQHIKSMVGVNAQDNHKFYSNVKPFTAHFEIIEEVRENLLNEREHYWIDYYNAVGDGYNTKK